MISKKIITLLFLGFALSKFYAQEINTKKTDYEDLYIYIDYSNFIGDILGYRVKMAQNLESIHSLVNDSNFDFSTNVNNDTSIVGGPYTIPQLMNYISWIGLEGTQEYSTSILSIPTELAKKNYVEGAANTKYTNTCN